MTAPSYLRPQRLETAAARRQIGPLIRHGKITEVYMDPLPRFEQDSMAWKLKMPNVIDWEMNQTLK